MLVTDWAWFEVVRIQNGNIWLEVREGQDRGRRVSVPMNHPEYSDEISETLRSLSIGDLCELRLTSESETAPSWYVMAVEETNDRPSGASRATGVTD